MTMWGKFVRKSDLGALTFTELPTPDGDEITIAVANAPDSGPRLLMLHGLEGGVRSHYVGGLWAVARELGWQPHLLLFRTCNGLMNRARRTYHSGETSDLELVVQNYLEEDPDRPICLVGVSLGGNVLLKWLGVQSHRLPRQVRGAVAVSTPFDLARSSRAIGSGFARVYEWNFLRSLKRKAAEKLLQYPDICSRETLDSVSSMWEFDDCFTAPLHGFKDAADYYYRCSSIHFVQHIQCPTLLLSAHDDPFYSRDVLADVERISAQNPKLTLEFHAAGGHVGFVGGAPWRPAYYLESRVAEFLAGCLAPDQERQTGVVAVK
jgi:predicted alpha/beta-fold hydrolase